MEQASQPQSFGAALSSTHGRRVVVRRNTIGAEENTGRKMWTLRSGRRGYSIYAWPIVGDTEYHAGMKAKYTVMLWNTGEISCDCRGWCNYPEKGELACKHVKRLDATRREIFRMWQNNEELPVAKQEEDKNLTVESPFNPNQPGARALNTSLVLGRIIDTD
jgi:hypothetical protein